MKCIVTRKQIILIALVFAFVILLAPPWVSNGNCLLFDPPSTSAEVDLKRLIIQLVLVLVIALIGLLVFGGKTLSVLWASMRQNQSKFRVLMLANVIFLLYALEPTLPYDYYTFLRVLTCAVTGFGAYCSQQSSQKIRMLVFALFAFVYNPIFKVHLERQSWEMVNIVTALVLGYAAIRFSAPLNRGSGGIPKTYNEELG